MIKWLRNLYWHWSYTIGWRQFCDRQMSRCRVCTSSKDVMVFDPRGIWAFPFRTTVCPGHCEDHDYEYEPGIGKCCIHCGEVPPHDYYY